MRLFRLKTDCAFFPLLAFFFPFFSLLNLSAGVRNREIGAVAPHRVRLKTMQLLCVDWMLMG